MKKLIFIAVIAFVSIVPAYGWNAVGHKIVAAIAYNNLTPRAKKEVDRLTRVLDYKYPPRARFLYAAPWADSLRGDDVNAFNSWHFIDYPHPGAENVVWAINQSITVLSSSHANIYEKALFLRFLIHFVGDVHQPMHCIDHDDQGGNLYSIKSKYATNLHHYWDQGLGLLLHYNKKLASKLEQQYPRPKNLSLNVTDWSLESYNIANNFAYSIAKNSALTASYQQQGKAIVKKRLVLAGYRLAALLNKIFA